jgi:hypothetical protein
VKPILLAAIALLQMGDVITTNCVLSLGGHEGNPLIAWTQVNLGNAWVIPKMLIAAGVILIVSRARTAKPAIFIAGFYLLVIMNNTLLIASFNH